MESAFGIDHGYEDISKFSLSGLGSGLGRLTNRAGGKVATGGIKTMKTNPGMGRFGQAQFQAGGQLRKLGQGMMRRPGLTGGVAAGGGAATLGGAAGAFQSHRRRQ